MKHFATGLIGLMILAAPAAAAARDSAVEAPIRQFATAFNKGDIPGALATMADTVAITDEVAPFHWEGKTAFASWGATDAKAKGITDPNVTVADPTRELITGDHAYVIVPATYTFKQKGVAMTETAQMTFSLAKEAGGWKVTGWTWTGPDASPVK